MPMALVVAIFFFINPVMKKHRFIPEIFVFFFLSILVVWSGVKSVVSNVDDTTYPIGFPLTIMVAYLTMRARILVPLLIGIICTLVYVLSFVVMIAAGYFPYSYRFPVYCVVILFFNVVSFIALYVVENFFRKLFVAQKQLEMEQERMKQENKRNETLLLNILPKHMVPKLKAVHHGIVMERNPDVSVLFSDICNFTKYSSTTPAVEVVFMLNNHFSYFDTLSSRLGLEKVKTIGDAYFCIGGLRDPFGENSVRSSIKIMEMATGMMRHIAKMNAKYGWSFQIRVGCASGSATAAIIGEKKYTFDCYGKTILYANEMESASIPGCVHVTQELYERGQDVFDFYHRGNSSIGSFGDQETYLILAKKGNVPITDMEHINNEGDAAFKYVRKTLTAGDNYGNEEAYNELYENDTVYSKVDLPEIEDENAHLTETPVKAEGRLGRLRKKIVNYFKQVDTPKELRYVPVLFFFRSWATEKKYFWESYKSTRYILILVLFIMWAFNILFVVNEVIVQTSYAGSPSLIVSYCLLGVQFIICVIICTPLGRNPVLGLLAALASMIIGYVMSIIIIISSVLSLEYVGFFSLCCVFMLSLPPNIPYIIKCILNLAVFALPILDYALYDHSWVLNLAFVLGTNIIMTFTYSFVDFSSRMAFILNQKSHQEIEKVEKEQKANEALILSALPKPIAERLKSAPESTFDTIQSGSVCFVKVYGFDDALIDSEVHDETVEYNDRTVKKAEMALFVLDRIFARFDEIASDNDCEKIKSIGATYMAVCGCPDYTPDHALRIASLALQFQSAAVEVLDEFKWLNFNLTVKIGVHAGGFVAGVLGSTKFLYDVFGDTVNTAARMCTTTKAGCIQCCGHMTDVLKDVYVLQERGVIPVKGKGDLLVHYLTGTK
jgi:class 3 adenylate cyclase